MKKPVLAIAADHAGIDLKKHLIESMTDVVWKDLGPHTKDSVDYPDYAALVCEAIHRKEADLGVLVCGSGIGMSIAANKKAGIRAASPESEETARLCREHNDVNVLCLGQRTLGLEKALGLAKVWLATQFQGGRHQQRVEKISQLEKRS